MKNDLTIRIAGEAGQGMQTIGISLCRLLRRTGYHVFAHQDYMSRIRGGSNFFQIRISCAPVCAPRKKCDVLVCLDRNSADTFRGNLNDGGVLVADSQETPLTRIAREEGGSDLYVNTVAFGLLAGMLGIEEAEVDRSLRTAFSGKGDDVIGKNISAAKRGRQAMTARAGLNSCAVTKRSEGAVALLSGNEALGLGVLAAGCRFYSAYPMSPSTGLMNVLAEYGPKYNLLVEQAEDEISAINMVVGASFAGVRAMTGTSGGGFALMQEGVSLAGMTETPVVILDAQRPAPATGFPTRTEQADLNLVIHAGHGEFARAVYAPGTAEEAFRLAQKAFNTAEKFQIPVIILSDQLLADSYRTVDQAILKNIGIERHLFTPDETDNSNYRRYRLTDTGISPRAVPSRIDGVIYADSDEHTEDGHITEDAGIRKAMVDKRFTEKMRSLAEEVEMPDVANLSRARVVLVGFGSTRGVVREVSDASDGKIGCIHLPQVWPLPVKALSELTAKAKKIITVENNAGAQLAGLIRRETGINVSCSILKYDGRPFDVDSLREEALKEVR